MATTARNARAEVTTAATSIYTVSSARQAVITACTVTNYSGGDEEITVWIVDSGDTQSNSNIVIVLKSITAGKEDILDELLGQSLDESQSIFVQGSANTALNIRLSFAEYS